MGRQQGKFTSHMGNVKFWEKSQTLGSRNLVIGGKKKAGVLPSHPAGLLYLTSGRTDWGQQNVRD